MLRTITLALLLGCFGLGRAHAQEDGRARRHYETAQAHVAAERYSEAYAEFSLGYELSRRAAFLFNMAECALHAGLRDQARTDYGRYLAQVPTGSMSDTARQRLSELGPAPTAAAPEPAQVVASPEVAAAASERRPAVDLRVTHEPLPQREIWQEEAFWAVAGSILALAIGGAIAGGVVASESGGNACSGSCVLVDFR